MKKILIVSLLSVALPVSAKVTEINPQCDNVKIDINTSMDDRLNFSAYWDEPANFPKKPETIYVGDGIRTKIKTFSFRCPNYSVKYDGDVIEIKSNNYEKIVESIYKYYRNLNLYHYHFYKYPNIKKGLFVSAYSFNIKSFLLKTSIYEAGEGQDLNKEPSKFYDIPKTAIIGYRTDDGALKPFLYNKKVSYYLDDFEEASTIDIYHNSNNEIGMDDVIQRIHIDKSGLLRIYRKYPFPEK